MPGEEEKGPTGQNGDTAAMGTGKELATLIRDQSDLEKIKNLLNVSKANDTKSDSKEKMNVQRGNASSGQKFSGGEWRNVRVNLVGDYRPRRGDQVTLTKAPSKVILRGQRRPEVPVR